MGRRMRKESGVDGKCQSWSECRPTSRKSSNEAQAELICMITWDVKGLVKDL